MTKIINMLFFRGWTRKERRDFWLSLLLTVIVLAMLMYVAPLIESVIRPHDHLDLDNTIAHLT